MTIGSEDVLDGEAPEEPERLDPADRTPFRTSLDVLVVVLITVVALVVSLIVWLTSEARHTTSATDSNPVPQPQEPTVFPPSLGEAWRAHSGATPIPVVAGPVVVTGDGGEVAGRDPLTGDVLWHYDRDLPLCTVTSAWSLAVAVFRTDGNLLPSSDPRSTGGCSEVTALDPATGLRGRQQPAAEQRERPQGGERNTDAELGTRLLADGTYVTTTGRRLLLTWRSDLVQTMEYGAVPDIVNPNKQPRTGCEYGSVAVAPGRIGVIERCPNDGSDRLTVYRATNGDNKSDEPAVIFSEEIGGRGARVVAMSTQRTAVAMPDPSRLVVFDDSGQQQGEYPLDVPASELSGDPDGLTVPLTNGPNVPDIGGPGAYYWFTGSRTVALQGPDLHPMWTVQGTLGSGTIFAGRLLVPVRNGIRVLDEVTGTVVGTTPVDRGGYSGPVAMSTIGPMVLEQRGADLVALR